MVNEALFSKRRAVLPQGLSVREVVQWLMDLRAVPKKVGVVGWVFKGVLGGWVGV